jgi:sarcosine oxidase
MTTEPIVSMGRRYAESSGHALRDGSPAFLRRGYDPAVRKDWDAIVVGLGAIGSGAAYWLSRRLGDRVLGLEQFELGHANGAGQDHSRIIRLSYHRPDYVRLARRAYQAWAEVEAESGVRIVTRTGGLDIGPRDGAIPLHDYIHAMTAESVAFEHLAGPEIVRRWPQWRLGDEHHGLYQADAGIADPNRGNAAHQRLARAHGATLLERTPVAALAQRGDGTIEVELADGTVHRAPQVVIAADAWTNDLLAAFDRRLPLTIIQAQVTYVAPPDPGRFAPDRFPIWIWMDDPSFYGFPTYGEAGPKAAEDVGGDEVTPATRTFDRNEVGFRRLTDFLERHLPDHLGPEISTKTCLYTLTPDRDFVIDHLPDVPGVHVALGAAHAFKFASVLGRILSELVVDGATPSAAEIGAFTIDRPILLEANPVTSFLV